MDSNIEKKPSLLEIITRPIVQFDRIKDYPRVN
ncbi:hypothetical protein J2S17_005464 [Cytobacillus purgationiresistens]|uniref:Uncharacterized protein n=1 Tax=Cytobacillus purgationiresistens TaxID=863449 RepID=A0ABU0ARV8_9BACI|nr:hypothetical protein [Cytobacillus purgationiresistens]